MMLQLLRLIGTAAALSLLSGCDQFNLAPLCEDTGPGLMRQLAVPPETRPDHSALSRIMMVSDFVEVDSDYNARICRATVAGPTQSVTLTYTVTQSEGVQGWYTIQLLESESSEVQNLIREVRYAYANG